MRAIVILRHRNKLNKRKKPKLNYDEKNYPIFICVCCNVCNMLRSERKRHRYDWCL